MFNPYFCTNTQGRVSDLLTQNIITSMASKKLILILGFISLFSTAVFSQRSDAGYDWRDSSKISTKLLPQQSEFLNNQYPYPARPRDQWELGIHAGHSFIIGDVPALHNLSKAGGFGVSLRKALGHVLSLQGDYTATVNTGMDYRLRFPNTIPGNMVNDPYKAIYGPGNIPYIVSYRTYIQQGSLDLVATLNNINYYRGNPKVIFNIFGGYSYLAIDTDVDATNSSEGSRGTRYNFTTINYGQSKKDIREALKANIFKDHSNKAYEQNAGTLNGRRFDALPGQLSSSNWYFRHAMNIGGSVQFKLSDKANLSLAQRITFVFDGDDLDATVAGVKNDFLSYTSVGLNFNIGNSSKKVQPLYWINPNNFIYNELNAPQHMKLPKPVLPDADGDGVTDQFDLEPNTPAGAPVDVHGVSRDTDGDGVPDYKDKELLTSQKCFPVDADGVGTCPEPACCKEIRELMNSRPYGGGDCGLNNLPSVQFRSGSKLSKDAQAVLASAAAQIKANPTCKIKVTGHGASDKRAQQLSWDRVNSVIRYLVEKQGIAEDRFIFSYGEEGEATTVDLTGTTEEGPNTVPAPHPYLKR